MGNVALQQHRAESRLVELRQSGIVRTATEPDVVSRVVAAGDPLYRGLLPNGGFPVGCISEIRGDASSGRLTVAVRTLLRAVQASERAALVTSLGFFPGLTSGLASALDGVLVCRMRSLDEALAAAEVLATSGAVDLLVVDVVGLHSGSESRARETTIARIERAARAAGAAIVVLTSAASAHAIGLGSKAAIRLETATARSGLPDGEMRPSLTLVRSRFARIQSSATAKARSVAAHQ